MSAEAQINGFSSGMAALQKDWPKLKPAQRQQRLQALASAQAQANGSPSPRLVKMTEKELKDDPQKNGIFSYKEWQIKVNPNLLQHNELSAQQAAALGDTIYHETRHAEQWYLIARRQAETEGKASTILKTFPPPVAKKAASQPLGASDCRRLCADQLYTSVWGAGSQSRNTTLHNLGPQTKAYLEAKKAHEAATKSGDQAKIAQAAARLAATQQTYVATYAAYRALPEEADAWDCGGRAKKGIEDALKPKGNH
ncbi:hypothetical protein [Massilia horti]|uniref:Uncharacterized protein n=1 Tax=Massilia horti TaxID=2562153 RepID=A0A4Y9T0Z0_9BURK|nr:hypothetical protein [Massilia horti]TFW32468.1 hypothetical protein E4O92_09790 [Massilia horti]